MMATLAHSTILCRACRVEKPSDQFYRVKNRYGQLYADNTCKQCRGAKVRAAKQSAIADSGEAERRRRWRKEHKRKLRREAGCQTLAERTQAKIERQKRLAAERASRPERKPEHDAHVRRWREMAKARERQRAHHATPQGCIDGRMRTAIGKALKGGKAGRQWEALVGYTLGQLVDHIERQFTKGMSWSNIGAWHIDHIRPRASFSYSSPECPEFKACWAITNLRPMWSEDNLAKRDRITLLL